MLKATHTQRYIHCTVPSDSKCRRRSSTSGQFHSLDLGLWISGLTFLISWFWFCFDWLGRGCYEWSCVGLGAAWWKRWGIYIITGRRAVLTRGYRPTRTRAFFSTQRSL
ncbi:hypothetical protein EDC01DRAFT_682768 [Geopyxis carbonaria]|nr:hypothetical protein EDC01DRAFT_682768 [Geopyxis carbonaria]